MILPYKQLIYVEAKGHYLAVHCTQQEPVEIRCRLSDMLAKLPEESFVQCHRGFVVNLLYVRNVSRTMLTLAGNKQIPVGLSLIHILSSMLCSIFLFGIKDNLLYLTTCMVGQGNSNLIWKKINKVRL